MKFIYSLFVELLRFGMFLGHFFNEKIKKGWEGRKQSYNIVKSTFSKKDKVIWMHASSLGEYQQGLPVLSNLKTKFPNHKVLVTFFSPSGYENIIQQSTIADVICYLPFDRKSEVVKFLDLMDVEYFFTVKYDYWYDLLTELKRRNTTIFIVSALFYSKQIFFSSFGKYFVKKLHESVDYFFHQTEESYQLALSIGLTQSFISGDTRYDKVKENYKNTKEVPFIKAFLNGKKAVVFGSSWETEEKIATIIEPKINGKIIIAPHDLKRVKKIKELFPEAILYSQLLEDQFFSNSKVLIIDSIGLLSQLYAYSSISIVGGGFHVAGLHNILESAVYGTPILFGDKYENHPEADELIKAGGAISYQNVEKLSAAILDLLDDEVRCHEMANNAKMFIANQPNSSEFIISKLLN